MRLSFSRVFGSVIVPLLALTGASDPVFAAPRLRSQVEAILGPAVDTAGPFRELKIVLVYGQKDHADGQHEYQKFADEWEPLLARMKNTTVSKAYYWPSAQQFLEADLIVFHLRPHNCNSNTGTTCTPLAGTGGVARLVDSAKFAQLDDYLARGKGMVTVHPANYPHQIFQDAWSQRTGVIWRFGGTTATNTTYREGLVTLNFRKTENPGHPILQGLPDTLKFDDEVYFPLFGHPDSINVLATSTETFQGASAPRPALWTYSPYGKLGRSYGFIMGHLHESFSDPVFRILLLRGMAWAARDDFARYRRVVLDSAHYVNDVVPLAPPRALRREAAREKAGVLKNKAWFEWKGEARAADGRGE